MAKSLFWKGEKVALTSLLFLLTFAAFAQTSSAQNITFTCRAIPLESVLTQISKQSGYDFMYSRNFVDVTKVVTISVKDKSIYEVLRLIESQVGVSFKLHDRHIIIKSNPKPVVVIAMKPIEKEMVEEEPAPLLTSISKTIPVREYESETSKFEHRLNKRIVELQNLLGTNVPHNIPSQYVKSININNRHKGFYASIGTFVSNQSSGLEFQAGLPYAFAVFNPSWSMEYGFYGAYGVGNTLPLWGQFSLNTMYLYSGHSMTESVYPFEIRNSLGPEYRYSQTKRFHQVKLELRYSFSKYLSLRAGPILNYNVTLNDFAPVQKQTQETYGFHPPGPGKRVNGGGTAMQVFQNIPARSSTVSVGWDISLQFRMNFFEKK